MSNEIFKDFREILNIIVGGQIENFFIRIDKDRLKGENFLGEIIFVSLTNKNKDEVIDVVVKQALKNLDQLDLFKDIYFIEIHFYENIWPVLNKFQEEHSVGFNKIPRCLTTSSTIGIERIILEDLSKQNFHLYEKTKPLDRKHYEFIFKCYGVYHAISFAFRELQSEDFSKLANLLKIPEPDRKGTERGQQLSIFVVRTMEYVRDLFDANKDAGIYEKLSEIARDPEKVIGESSTYSGDTPVILHGDCWSNNMMFKYDEHGNIEDIRFLDFQMVVTGSPVRDLSYCLYSGASKDAMDSLNNLLIIYIDSFSETIEKFNCKPKKPYTLDLLKSEWKLYGKFGYMMGVMLWRLKLVDKNHIPKVTDESVAHLYPVAQEHVEEFNQRLKDLSIHLYENGYF